MSSLIRILLAALTALATSPSPVQAQRKAAPLVKAPPPPMAAAVRVKRGETVEIPLRIHGARSQTLEFRIRSAPRAGRLSEVKQTEPEAAAVTYAPPADLAVKSDRFSYAVRSSEGVSAPVEVTIAIVDAAPALAAPEALEFSRLPLGDKSEQTFEVVNAGGGLAEGEVEIDAPWRLEGGRQYRLGAGERRSFKVVFAPSAGGTFAGEIRYSSQRDRATSLSGSAQAPLTFAHAKLALAHAPGDPIRNGVFEVTNHTTVEQTVTFTADERLAFPRSAKVAAGAMASVAVELAATDTAPLAGEIRAEAAGFSAALPVAAPAVGAIVRTAQPRVDFGQPRPDAPARAALVVENVGGLPANLSAQVGAPFSTNSGSRRLEPGAKEKIEVGFTPPGEGVHRAVLQVRSESGLLEVPVEARVASTPRLPRQTVAASRAPPAALLVKNEARAQEEAVAAAPRRVRVRQVTTDTAAIEWPAALSDAPRFRAEERRLSVRNRELKTDWTAHDKFTTERRGSVVAGVFTGLTPGQIYVMRVVPIDTAGRKGETLVETQFRTFLEPPSRFRVTPMRLLVVALIACAAALVWQRRKQRRT